MKSEESNSKVTTGNEEKEGKRGKEGKATQPSCDEPNPRGTEGGEQKGANRRGTLGWKKGNRMHGGTQGGTQALNIIEG